MLNSNHYGSTILYNETINMNTSPEKIIEIKKLGFLIKLDTNGTNPACLQELINEKLIDTNLIERYILNKGGKFTYFRTTEDLEKLIYIKHEKHILHLYKVLQFQYFQLYQQVS